MLIQFNLSDFLDDLNTKLNYFINKYTSSPIFLIVTAAVLFIIGCWAIRYLGRK